MVLPRKAFLSEWENYTNHGRHIEGTNFVLVRTPLRDDMFRNNNVEATWTPDIMVQTIGEQLGKPVGLVVDMTATGKYYRPSNIYRNGVDFYKLPVPGGKPPMEGYVQQFIRVVESFLLYRMKGIKKTVPPLPIEMEDAVCKTLNEEEAQDHAEMLENTDFTIVVHCTHGVNRSGYLCARYLMDKMGISPEEAVQRVEDSRGYPLTKYREVLLDNDLRQYLRHRMKYFYGISTLLFHPYIPDSRCIQDPPPMPGFANLLPEELEIDVQNTPGTHL